MMVDNLETTEGRPRAEREILYGLKYEPSEVLWCRQVRRHLRLPY